MLMVMFFVYTLYILAKTFFVQTLKCVYDYRAFGMRNDCVFAKKTNDNRPLQ